ncbi:MAG: ABC transporter ATP-binding protein [Spirochaetales bacterium]|nr:ABC transporter ATP-binding protein [Spirochaetales bacterium]
MLHVENVQKRFKKHTVLAGISFELGDDEFAVLYGLPGSGKSVLLRTIMGLERPDGGTVKIRDGDAATMLPGERNIGYVPQSFALFPDKSVRENIGYPLTFTDTPRDEITDAVDSVAKMLQIQDHLEKLPSQLSGGQKQRVAIARGLVKKTSLFFLDDPLAGLDFKLREQLVDDLRGLQEKLRATFLYATSDPMEALSLGNRILAVHSGRIVDDQSPRAIYTTPQHIFPAERMSFPVSNSLPATVRMNGDTTTCEIPGLASVKMPKHTAAVPGQEIVAVIKPEDIELETEHSSESSVRFEGRIQLREDLGGEQILYLSVNDIELRSVLRHEVDEYLAGETARFRIRTGRIGLFAHETGVFIAHSEELIDVGN